MAKGEHGVANVTGARYANTIGGRPDVWYVGEVRYACTASERRTVRCVMEAGCVSIKGEKHYAMSVMGPQFARTANENRDAIFVAIRSYAYIIYKKRNVESVVEVSFASTENVFRDASNVVDARRAITNCVVQGDKQSIKGFVTFAS